MKGYHWYLLMLLKMFLCSFASCDPRESVSSADYWFPDDLDLSSILLGGNIWWPEHLLFYTALKAPMTPGRVAVSQGTETAMLTVPNQSLRLHWSCRIPWVYDTQSCPKAMSHFLIGVGYFSFLDHHFRNTEVQFQHLRSLFVLHPAFTADLYLRQKPLNLTLSLRALPSYRVSGEDQGQSCVCTILKFESACHIFPLSLLSTKSWSRPEDLS